MSVRISWRMTTATIGPKTPPRPPARLTPPSTTAATLSSVYGPGTGVPIPVLAVERQAGERREQAGQRRRRRSSSGRRTRRSGRPPAGCCRWRRATGRGATAGWGSRSAATMTSSTTAAFGIHSLPSDPMTRSVQPLGGAAAGRRQDEQRAAGPDERHRQRDDDVGHAGDDDEAAVDRAEDQAEEERRRGRPPIANSSRWPFISDAATTLVSAIIEPIDRSIPPEITTIAWATAASASGRTEIARPWMPGTP